MLLKLTRAKLNSLLKSGVNPRITTRKQLANHLDMDPTSITRWFANRDRLGNPRLPVVPERHIARLVALFEIDSQALELDEGPFHQYCTQLAISNSGGKLKLPILSRQQKIANRRLSIPSRQKQHWLVVIAVLSLIVVVYWVYFLSSSTTDVISSEQSEKCWQGYSEDLGEFEKNDPLDPCHYRKLYMQGLKKMETSPDSQNHLRDYLTFLASQLDQRRAAENQSLFQHLGIAEFKRGNLTAASEYLKKAMDYQGFSSINDKQKQQQWHLFYAASLLSSKGFLQGRLAYEAYLYELADKGRPGFIKIRPEHQILQQLIEVATAYELKELSLAYDTLMNIAVPSSSVAKASLYLLTAILMAEQGDFQQAVNLGQTALDLDTDNFGALHPRAVQISLVLSNWYVALGHDKKAETHHKRLITYTQDIAPFLQQKLNPTPRRSSFPLSTFLFTQNEK